MDWFCGVMLVVLGIIACIAVSHWQHRADVADERRGRTVEIIERLVDSTAYQEPSRLDANDPLRDRFVFCGRWLEHGHGRDCPWMAAVSRVRPLAQPARPGAAGDGLEG